MVEKYRELGKAVVFRDISRNGLLTNFLKDYKLEFGGGKLNPSCSSCRNEYWTNYLNLFEMKEIIECDYVLHQKYSGGVKIGFNGRPIRNGEMTNEVAAELLRTHPRGELLFSKLPESKEIEVKEEVIIEPKKIKRRRKTTK
tara:strand:- start:200 stop:625 length:426 start_codon:yes stop_codon:yes gene_type:complete